MEFNKESKMYDPLAALTRMRNQTRNDKIIQSSSERGYHNYEENLVKQEISKSQYSSRKSITPIIQNIQTEEIHENEENNNENQNIDSQKIQFLEEQNKKLYNENCVLRKENAQIKQKYENEINGLKEKIIFLEQKYEKLTDFQQKQQTIKTEKRTESPLIPVFSDF